MSDKFTAYRELRSHVDGLSVYVLAAWGRMKRVKVLEMLVCDIPVFSVLS